MQYGLAARLAPLLVVLASCSHVHEEIRPYNERDMCPLPEVTWTYVHDGFDEKHTLDLAGQIESAVKAEQLQITTSGAATVNFGAAYREVLAHGSKREFAISESTTKVMEKFRAIGCAIYAGIYVEKRSDAEAAMLSIISGVELEKKSLESKAGSSSTTNR